MGQAVSRTTYADLFAIIGTKFGVGDGTTTFNIPNLKGRSFFGYDFSFRGGGTAAINLILAES
jgi:microcystin-dependent protein